MGYETILEKIMADKFPGMLEISEEF